MEGTNITIPIDFAAGLLSFLSPCVLPLVPGYVSLISGVSIDRLKGDDGSRSAARRAVILNSIAFNIGLSMIFVSLGALAGLLGASITSNPWLRIIGGVVIIGFGLQLMGVLKIGALYRDTRFFSQQKPRGMLGSMTLGMAYAAGLAVPFLVTGLSINKFLNFYSKFRQHLHKVEVVSGSVLLLIGLAVAF